MLRGGDRGHIVPSLSPEVGVAPCGTVMNLQLKPNDIRWWFWTLTLLLIVLALTGSGPGYAAVIVLSGLHLLYFLVQEGVRSTRPSARRRARRTQRTGRSLR